MPSARANIRAKFIAQIDTSKNCDATKSAPADEARPRIVRSNGSPAATSAPNASTRIARVTGQLISSERIIASRLAALKSDHMPDAPVRLTLTWSVPAARSSPFRSSAARTISIGSFAEPAMTIAVRPSAEIVAPCWGGVTDATRASERRIDSVRPMTAAKAGSAVVRSGDCRTTINPELALPAKFAWMRSRAWTDCEPESSQPAPESAVSTRGASTPSEMTMTAQAMKTVRARVADQRPRRPMGPSALIGRTRAFP